MWYWPEPRNSENVIGYTAVYVAFHAPRLEPPTRPESAVRPAASTTWNETLLTGDRTIKYACLASPGRYPTWSTRTRPAGAGVAADAGWVPSPSAATLSRATTRIERIAGLPANRQAFLLLAGTLGRSSMDVNTYGRFRRWRWSWST